MNLYCYKRFGSYICNMSSRDATLDISYLVTMPKSFLWPTKATEFWKTWKFKYQKWFVLFRLHCVVFIQWHLSEILILFWSLTFTTMFGFCIHPSLCQSQTFSTVNIKTQLTVTTFSRPFSSTTASSLCWLGAACLLQFPLYHLLVSCLQLLYCNWAFI